jgi:hypothetical protein
MEIIKKCQEHPILCLLAIAVVITIVVMYMAKKKAEHVVDAPSVLSNPNVATGLARTAEDVARNRKGLTIRDYQLENKLLTAQGV